MNTPSPRSKSGKSVNIVGEVWGGDSMSIWDRRNRLRTRRKKTSRRTKQTKGKTSTLSEKSGSLEGARGQEELVCVMCEEIKPEVLKKEGREERESLGLRGTGLEVTKKS